MLLPLSILERRKCAHVANKSPHHITNSLESAQLFMPLKHKGNMELRFRTVLWVILIIVMVGCFVVQMEEQLEKFIKKQTTVAVSFEGRETQRFPTFAFCDHRGYRMDMRFAATAARYNSTTFDVESEVILHGICEKDYACGKKPKYNVRMVPTTYNGYCKVYEFLEEYQMRIYGGDTLYNIFIRI